MAWITLLQSEALAGPRIPFQVRPPTAAAKFEVRIPLDEVSRLSPTHHVQLTTSRAVIGAVATAYTQIAQATFRASGYPEAEGVPGSGSIPVNFPAAWQAGNELKFDLLQTHDNGGDPTIAGLQVRWFNSAGVELDGDGQIDPDAVP
jgi:hypothetical protein